MKTRLALVLGVVSSLLATSAFADEGVVESVPAAKLSVGAQLELVPFGSLKAKALGVEQSRDIETAYAIGGNFGYAITPFLSIGAAPRLILNLVPKDVPGAEAGKQIDLRARVLAHFGIAPKLQVFGYAAPGYSILIPPSSSKDDNATGFAIGFGGGVSYDVSPAFYVTGELGYQFAFLSTKELNADVDLDANVFSVGLGAGTRF